MDEMDIDILEVPSQSEPGHKHSVCIWGGCASCDCIGFRTRKSCSHVKHALERRAAALLLAPLKPRLERIVQTLSDIKLDACDPASAMAIWKAVDEMSLQLARIKAKCAKADK
jgi:hypothetical protein